MKGIYIFEVRETKGVVDCVTLDSVDHEFTQILELGKCTPKVDVDLQAEVKGVVSNARCSKDDTYDFETGALIALMRLCGVEKVKKAAKETFFDVADNSVNEYEEKIRALEKKNKYLKEKLVKRKKMYNALSGQATSAYEEKMKENAELKQQVEKLEEENKRDKYTIKQLCLEHTDLKTKNDKLRKDIEKLGGLYNKLNYDTIICGGRACGKQYKALAELFKRLPQGTVDAAYKETYNTGLAVWQKELLNWLFGTCKKPEEKAEAPTKREQMWNDIRNGKITFVKVEKAFINDFLSEAEENGIVWANGGEKPTEWNRWDDWRRHDYIVFQIWNFPPQKELTWGVVANKNAIDYLPPMRWDLFKKRRMIVRVTSDNIDDFLKECEKNCGIKESEAFMEHLKTKMKVTDHHGFIKVFKHPQINKLVLHFMGPDDLVRNQNVYPDEYAAKKIVDWEEER